MGHMPGASAHRENSSIARPLQVYARRSAGRGQAERCQGPRRQLHVPAEAITTTRAITTAGRACALVGWLHRQLAEGSADVGVAHNVVQQRVHQVLRQPLEIRIFLLVWRCMGSLPVLVT